MDITTLHNSSLKYETNQSPVSAPHEENLTRTSCACL